MLDAGGDGMRNWAWTRHGRCCIAGPCARSAVSERGPHGPDGFYVLLLYAYSLKNSFTLLCCVEVNNFLVQICFELLMEEGTNYTEAPAPLFLESTTVVDWLMTWPCSSRMKNKKNMPYYCRRFPTGHW